MWPDLELIGVYPSKFSEVYFTSKGVFTFSIELKLGKGNYVNLWPGRSRVRQPEQEVNGPLASQAM